MKIQNIINKVPHAVNILDEQNRVIKVFKRSNEMARVPQFTVPVCKVDGVPITSTKASALKNVPEPVAGTFYIVSQLVKTSMPGRPDLLVPRGMVKDDEGNILGCKSLDLGDIKISN